MEEDYWRRIMLKKALKELTLEMGVLLWRYVRQAWQKYDT